MSDARPNTDAIENTVQEHRRRTILLLLHEHLRGLGNDDLLQSLLDQFGFRETRETVRDDLTFLERSATIGTRMHEGFMVAELKRDGAEFVEGRRSIQGVADRGYE